MPCTRTSQSTLPSAAAQRGQGGTEREAEVGHAGQRQRAWRLGAGLCAQERAPAGEHGSPGRRRTRCMRLAPAAVPHMRGRYCTGSPCLAGSLRRRWHGAGGRCRQAADKMHGSTASNARAAATMPSPAAHSWLSARPLALPETSPTISILEKERGHVDVVAAAAGTGGRGQRSACNAHLRRLRHLGPGLPSLHSAQYPRASAALTASCPQCCCT